MSEVTMTVKNNLSASLLGTQMCRIFAKGKG